MGMLIMTCLSGLGVIFIDAMDGQITNLGFGLGIMLTHMPMPFILIIPMGIGLGFIKLKD